MSSRTAAESREILPPALSLSCSRREPAPRVPWLAPAATEGYPGVAFAAPLLAFASAVLACLAAGTVACGALTSRPYELKKDFVVRLA